MPAKTDLFLSPLRQSSFLPLLRQFPYGAWMDAVLAEIFPGIRWEFQQNLLVAALGPGMVLCLYASSAEEVRLDLCSDLASEPVCGFAFNPRSFHPREFLNWFRELATYVQDQLQRTHQVLGCPSGMDVLQVRWPQSKIGCLNFPLSISRMGRERRASLIFEDAIALSQNHILWPLCGACVVVGYEPDDVTATAALLAQADQAAAKHMPMYFFRSASVKEVLSFAGDLRKQVASRLFLAPEGGSGAAYLRDCLQPGPQTVLADLGAELSFRTDGQDEWQQQLQVLASRPTCHVLFLSAPRELSPDRCVQALLSHTAQLARIYWVESAGRLCPAYVDGADSAPSARGVIFHPFI